MAETKFYGLRNDYMFKAVLQNSRNALRNLISALLDIDEDSIEDLTVLNTIELGKSVDSKDCILDVKLELNTKEIIDLEMQVRNEGNWPERSLLYWSRAYDDLSIGEDYDKLKKTYHIGILDFTLFDENPSFYAEYKIMDTSSHWIYSDKLNIRILDLSRIRQAEETDENPQLIKWAKIFVAESMSEIDSLICSEEVFKDMAVVLKELSEDEKIRQQCQARDDYERRLIGQYNHGYKAGVDNGIEQGIKKGIKQGIEQGIEQGQNIAQKKFVLNALNSGHSAEEVAEFLQIDLETVQKIQMNI